METFEIEINKNDAKRLLAGDLDMEVLLQATFKQEAAHQLMKTAIEQENSVHAGSPELECFTLDRLKTNYSTLTGKFRVVYDLNFTFGCEGLKREKEDQTSEWTFQCYPNHTSILFKGPQYRDLRTTEDEF